MVEHIPADELFWTAARYAWGELSPEDHAAFEERLAHDEAACLAVAEAVRLTVHLKAATAQSCEVRPARNVAASLPDRRWTAAWLTVAMLAVATAWFAMQQATPSASVDLASSELLARWTDAGSLPDADAWDDFDSEPDVLDESLAAPSWLVQAVELANEAEMRTP